MINFDMMSVVRGELANVKTMCPKEQRVNVGVEVADMAKRAFNVASVDFFALQRGDIIHFPNTLEDMNNMLIAKSFHPCQANPTIQLMIVVERQGRCFAMPIDKNILCRYGVDENGEKIYAKGEPSLDFRKGSSIYDGFAAFVGKSLRVVSIDKIPVRALKRGAMRDPELGCFHESDFCLVEKKFYELEYVCNKA